MSQTRGPETLDKETWVKYYWFSPLQMVEVINPAWAKDGDGFVSQDYPFMVELRHFMLPAGTTDRFPGTLANVYLDQMSKILAQNDDQLGFMADPNLRRKYFDSLIVDVEDMVKESSSAPAYLSSVPKSVMPKDEVAPWDASVGERARDVAPQVPSPQVPIINPPKTPKEETKEFDFNGLKFKSVTDKSGETIFYKNDKEIDEATYAKAASMI